MSTVLTNGVIIPENGSRNWGGDLANNWNILDVNVGYMTDVKNSVTTLENSVAENTANIEINTSNISALQTSKQDNLSEQQIANIADVTNKANDSDVVHKRGAETIAGIKTFTNDIFYKNGNLDLTVTPTSNTYANFIFSDKNNKTLGYLQYGKQTTGNCDIGIYLYDSSRSLHGLQVTSNNYVVPLTNNAYDLGSSSAKWKDIYATNAVINTSDRNAKTSIKNIDDNILEAWGKVSLISFKFKDAVEKKGDGARIHTGYIAQDIKEELNKYGIDACRYGLFCYNSWDAQEEKSHEEERTDEEGNIETVKVIDTPATEAGETYGLRYIECLVVECAYLRKKNKELEDRITKLEEKFN